MSHVLTKSPSVFVASVFAQDVRQQISSIASHEMPVELVGLGAMHDRGMLVRMIESLDTRLGTKFRRRLNNFVVSEVGESELKSVLWPRVREMFYRGVPSIFPQEGRGDRMGLALDLAGSTSVTDQTRLVFAREDAAENTFLTAKRLNIPTIYDQPTPHHATVSRLMQTELIEFEHAATTVNSSAEWAVARTDRKTREAKLASHILVASEMTKESLCDIGIAPETVSRIPYGCKPINESELPKGSRKPVVLYVGNISLRKGIPRLLRMWRQIGGAKTHTLRLVGKMCLPKKYLQQFEGCYEHVPWVPREELKRHYSESSFFVFPTVADGFGLVLNEAISYGLPVLASSNNGARGFMNHGQHALLYQHGNDDDFGDCLERMLSQSVNLQAMSREAAELSRQWQWSDYRVAVARIVEETLVCHENRTAINV